MPHLGSAVTTIDDDSPVSEETRRIRLLSYNVQIGNRTDRYRKYVTESWKHVLPCNERFATLDHIAGLIQDYDIVGLQELDAGSLRSGFVNLTRYLAERAGFPYWYDKTNRHLGRVARHATGVLSRIRPFEISQYRLPGRIPGRGILGLRFGQHRESLMVFVAHLALSRRARMDQVAFISELLNQHRHVVLMGDLNCHSRGPEMRLLLSRTDLQEPLHNLHTFPSWRPQKNIDHILVGPTLTINEASVVRESYSDHLPLAMEIEVPASIQLVG